MNNDRLKVALAWLGVGVCFLASAAFGFTYEPPFELEDSFTGTFLSGDIPYVLTFSVELEGNDFYYADQFNGKYIHGRIEQQEDGTYAVACTSDAGRAVIPDQVVQYADRAFTIEIDGTAAEFTKTDDIPCFFRDRESYT